MHGAQCGHTAHRGRPGDLSGAGGWGALDLRAGHGVTAGAALFLILSDTMRRAIAVPPRAQWREDSMVDAVTLACIDRHRRRIRLVADSGVAFLLDLPRAQHF